MWNVALDAAEVAALNAGVSPRLIRPSALVFYAPLRERFGPTPEIRQSMSLAYVNGPNAANSHPKQLDYRGQYYVRKLPAGPVTTPLTLTAGLTLTPSAGKQTAVTRQAAQTLGPVVGTVKNTGGGGGGPPTMPGTNGKYTTVSNSTTHAVPYPTVSGGILAGDIVLCFFGVDVGTNTITWPGTFTAVTGCGDQDAGTGVNITSRGGVAYRRCTGGESGTFTVTVGTTEHASAITVLVRGAHATSVPEGAFAASNAANPDPPNLTPSWGSDADLWFAAAICDAAVVASAAPSGYSNLDSQLGDASAASVSIASRTNTASSEDPGAFTAATEQFASFTIAVRPAPSAGGTSTPKTLTAALTLTPTRAGVVQAIRQAALTLAPSRAIALQTTRQALVALQPSLGTVKTVPGGTTTPKTLTATVTLSAARAAQAAALRQAGVTLTPSRRPAISATRQAGLVLTPTQRTTISTLRHAGLLLTPAQLRQLTVRRQAPITFTPSFSRTITVFVPAQAAGTGTYFVVATGEITVTARGNGSVRVTAVANGELVASARPTGSIRVTAVPTAIIDP
jgi:hypothetical protein